MYTSNVLLHPPLSLSLLPGSTRISTVSTFGLEAMAIVVNSSHNTADITRFEQLSHDSKIMLALHSPMHAGLVRNSKHIVAAAPMSLPKVQRASVDDGVRRELSLLAFTQSYPLAYWAQPISQPVLSVALALLFPSPWMVVPPAIFALPSALLQELAAWPAVWEGTKLLAGAPDEERIVVARQGRGQGMAWAIGGVLQGTLVVDVTALDAGRSWLVLWDGVNGIEQREMAVGSDGMLPLTGRGGLLAIEREESLDLRDEL